MTFVLVKDMQNGAVSLFVNKGHGFNHAFYDDIPKDGKQYIPTETELMELKNVADSACLYVAVQSKFKHSALRPIIVLEVTR